MTSIMDMVQQHLGADGAARLGQHLGVDQATAQAAVAAALPALVGAVSNRTSQPGGGGLLGELFGGNHQETVQQVSHHSGLDLHQAEKALLFLAPIVMARMAQGQSAAAQQPAQRQKSGLGRIVDAVDRIFHKGS